jgi:hypothetical protein
LRLQPARARRGWRFRKRLPREGGERGELVGGLLRAEIDDAGERHGGRARLLAKRGNDVGDRLVSDRQRDRCVGIDAPILPDGERLRLGKSL